MSPTFKIMVAVDLSDYSPTIVHYGLCLSKQLNADLVLVNVINQRDLDMVQRSLIGYEAFSFPNYLTEQVQYRETKMKEITEQVQYRETKMKEIIEAVYPDRVNCNYLVQTGIPYRELLTAIENEKPSLLVVGTKGRSNLADVVVGSTARKLYRRSPIPLLTIPAGFNELP